MGNAGAVHGAGRPGDPRHYRSQPLPVPQARVVASGQLRQVVGLPDAQGDQRAPPKVQPAAFHAVGHHRHRGNAPSLEAQQVLPLGADARAADEEAHVLAGGNVALDVIATALDAEALHFADVICGNTLALQGKYAGQIGKQLPRLPWCEGRVEYPPGHALLPGAYLRSNRVCKRAALRSSMLSNTASSVMIWRSGRWK